MSDFIDKVVEFNEIAGTPAEFNPRKCALYTGLVLEEVAELIQAYGDNSLGNLYLALNYHSQLFKEGHFDDAANSINRLEALDGGGDIAVVALGQCIALGADAKGACNEIMDSNLSKFPIDANGRRTVLKDANGKVAKPPSYRKPELAKFLTVY